MLTLSDLTDWQTLKQSYKISPFFYFEGFPYLTDRVMNAKPLHQHVQSIHNGDHHSCEFCEYKASRKDNLQQHV